MRRTHWKSGVLIAQVNMVIILWTINMIVWKIFVGIEHIILEHFRWLYVTFDMVFP